MIQTLIQVALGGAIGASLRYITNMAALRVMGTAFPWGTLAVNVAGSFAMGVLFVVLSAKDATRLSPLLLTGVLGGFTTFSAFSLDAIALIEKGRLATAGLYVAGSVGLSLFAIIVGIALARGIWA
ncbi:fluoride efflux transporter CrcB [Pseudogemmobacter sp. W21_MBD1_M6]|uniref:fluoride efflux transporter CrcB n=1 Tax=Pseudogemmobacter sp. W21_MBD1_M6 TaxID=3240271 RepID=UPI003F972772